MFEQDLDHGFWIIDVVVGIQLLLFEQRIFTHKIFHRIFEPGNDVFQSLAVRRRFNIKDNFVFDSKFPGDRQGIFRGTSMRVVINGNICHRSF